MISVSRIDHKMSTLVPCRQLKRRNSMDDNRPKTNLNIDCSSPTNVVGSSQPGAAPPVSRRRTMRRTAAPADTNCSQPKAQQQVECGGLSTSPIDVEAIEEEVQFVSSTSRPPQARTHSSRNRLVMIDEDSDNHPRGAGSSVEIHTASVKRNMGQRRIPEGHTVIDCDALSSEENFQLQKKRGRVSSPEPPPKEVPKEPTFTCPVCMNPLEQAASTICGHIFCLNCIKTAVQVQKKCPTCRKKLTAKNNFHRIYLPTRD